MYKIFQGLNILIRVFDDDGVRVDQGVTVSNKELIDQFFYVVPEQGDTSDLRLTGSLKPHSK